MGNRALSLVSCSFNSGGDVNGDRVADFEIQIFGIIPLASGDFLL